MSKKVVCQLTIVTLLAVMFSVTAWAVSLVRGRSDTKQDQNVKVAKQKTLREIAQERDVELVANLHSETEFSDLRSLAKSAVAIVLGRITEAKSSFSESGDFIETYYSIDIQRVLKDTKLNALLKIGRAEPTPLTTPLRLVRMGGVVEMNRHRASLKVKGQDLLTKAKDYIFFLYWSPDYKAYILAGGISGVVLVEDGLVKPLGTKKELGLKKYESFDLDTFVTEILVEK